MLLESEVDRVCAICNPNCVHEWASFDTVFSVHKQSGRADIFFFIFFSPDLITEPQKGPGGGAILPQYTECVLTKVYELRDSIKFMLCASIYQGSIVSNRTCPSSN